ncbi:MAG: YfhO family protein [Balneolaceae bacterium]
MERSRPSGPGRPNQREHLAALAVLLLLPVLFFFPTILGGEQFMGHDTLQWRAGAESIYDYRAEHDGEEPLWASRMFSGMPAYTIHVFKSVPHLDNLVFDQLRMIWPAVPYWVLLGGLYFLFLLMGARPWAAVFGSLLFGLTTYLPIIIGAGHNIKFIAYSYIPWMLAGYWLMTRHPSRSLWGLFLFTIATTLEFRAGHPQVTYYFVYLFIALYLYDSWRAWTSNQLPAWGRVTALLTAGTLVGFLGTAEQYWRLMEYAPFSIRGGSALGSGGGGLSIEYAFSWSQGILETFTLAIPDLFGGSSGMAYWGDKPGTSGPHYAGVATLFFALIALFRSERPIKWLWFGIALLTLSFAWGYHFPLNELWFHLLPGFDKFRTPEMWLTVTVFSLGILAVLGLEELLSSRSSRLKPYAWPAGILVGFGLLFLIGGPTLLSFEKSQETEQIATQLAQQNNVSADNPQVIRQSRQYVEGRLKPEREALARTDTLRFLFILAILLAWSALWLNRTLSDRLYLGGLILITAADLLTVGHRYINDEAMVDTEQTLTGVIEQSGQPADRAVRERIKDRIPQPRTLPLDDNAFNNAIPSYFYPSIGGYSGAKLSVYQDLLDHALNAGPQGLNFPLLDMLQVHYITTRRELSIPGFEPVFHEDRSWLYQRTEPMPRAWFVSDVRSVDNPREAIMALLPESDFDPRTLAVVESRKDIQVEPDSASSVEILSWTDRRMQLSLSRSHPGFLVLSEIWYPPGWVARLDGEEIPIHKTNYALRGFEIPPGNHQLTLAFEPRSHRAGSRISWVANLVQWILGVGLLIQWIRTRQQGER